MVPTRAAPPLRTARASLVLRRTGLSTAGDDADPLVRLVSTFLMRVPTWASALRKGVPEAEALWAVEWLVDHGVPEEELSWAGLQWLNTYTPMDRAAKRGFLSVVAFLHEHGAMGCTEYAMEHAAKHGHTSVVQFLHEHQCVGFVSTALFYAAIHGHLNVVRYAHETARTPLSVKDWAIAAKHGHLDVLQYIHARLPPEEISGYSEHFGEITNAAVAGKFTSVVKWLHELGPEARVCSQRALHRAILSSGTDVVRFVLEQQYPVDFVQAMDYAAGLDALEMVALFHELSPAGCTTQALDSAAASGHLQIVRFLNENRSEGCTTAAMDQAAPLGALDVVRYLHEHRTEGCTTAAMDEAAQNGHLDVVKYLHENRTEGCTTAAIDTAAERGHLDVVQYLTENRPEGCTTKAIDAAASNGHLDIVRYLHEHSRGGCTSDAMNKAAANGHLEVVRFLHGNGIEGSAESALSNAALKGHAEVVRFLCESGGYDVVVSNEVTKACVYSNRLELLMYLHSKHLVAFVVEDFVLAVSQGNVEIVEFLYDACVANTPARRSEWIRAAIEEAAGKRHLDVLVLLDSKRLEGEVFSSRAIQIASTNSRLDVAEYLLTNGHEGPTVELMDLAAARGRLDLVRFLHENRSDGCTFRAVRWAARYGHMDVVRFLLENRSEGCVRDAAEYSSHFQGPAFVEEVAALYCSCRFCVPGGPPGGTLEPFPWANEDY